MERQPATYLLASGRNGTLYVGVTSNLVARVWQHRQHVAPGFTQRYGVLSLVWYELHPTMEAAIVREKRIKHWKRAWRIELVEKGNPCWRDPWPELLGSRPAITFLTSSPRKRGPSGFRAIA